MAELGILVLGFCIGLFSCIVTTIFGGIENAEKYPVGAFLSVGLVPFGLGAVSRWAEAGLLTLGSLFGYYLFLRLWKGRPQIMRELPSNNAPEKKEVAQTTQSQPTSGNLADYL